MELTLSELELNCKNVIDPSSGFNFEVYLLLVNSMLPGKDIFVANGLAQGCLVWWVRIMVSVRKLLLRSNYNTTVALNLP